MYLLWLLVLCETLMSSNTKDLKIILFSGNTHEP